MQKQYIALALVCGAAALAMGSQINPAKPALEFNKGALAPPAAIDFKAGLSPSRIVLPLDLGMLAQRADQALAEQLVVHEWVGDGACAKRNLAVACTTAKLEGTITRNGPVEMQTTESVVKLTIPVKYTLTATGIGWASYLSENKAADAVIDLSFAITGTAAGGLDVTKRDDPASADAPIALLKTNVRLSRLLDARLKPIAKAAEDELRRALNALPVKQAVTRAWDALAQPLELGQGSGLWLKGAPEYYTVGALVASGRQMSYQIPVATRLSITEAGQANGAKRAAAVSQDPAPTGPSRVRLAVPIDLEAMRQAADAAFVNGTVFESRADRFSEPVKVKVKSTRIYPAQRQIGIELDVEATTLKGATFSGKLHLAGRPVLDTAAGTVTLADISFPPVSGKDAANQSPGMPRLGSEPFASAFAAVAKLDLSRALADVVPRARQMLNQDLGGDLVLQTEIAQATPVSLELARDGAWLMVDLVGKVTLVYDGAKVAQAAVTPVAEKTSTTATETTSRKTKTVARHARHVR